MSRAIRRRYNEVVVALILFSHGSLLCGAGEALEAHAERLRATGRWPVVVVGYLNYSEPPFLQAVADVAAAGATEVIVAPYFLVPGYFVTKSLPAVIEIAKREFPAIEIKVAEALGTDEILVDAVLEAALGARPKARWRDPLASAAAACRPSAVCPLYGTLACPKVPIKPIGEQE